MQARFRGLKRSRGMASRDGGQEGRQEDQRTEPGLGEDRREGQGMRVLEVGWAGGLGAGGAEGQQWPGTACWEGKQLWWALGRRGPGGGAQQDADRLRQARPGGLGLVQGQGWGSPVTLGTQDEGVG